MDEVAEPALSYNRLLTRMRLILLIATVGIQWGLSFRQMLGDLDRSTPPSVEVAAFGALATTTAVIAASLIIGARTSVTLDTFLALSSLAAGTLANVVTPPDRLMTADDWVFGLIGWFGLMVLVHRPPLAIVAFLAAHLVLSLGGAVLLGGGQGPHVPEIVIAAIPVFGLQLMVAFVVVTMRRTIAATDLVAAQNEALRTREAIAAQARRDHHERLAELRAGVLPLLAALAECQLDLSAPETRRRCAIEAARMRRLFAEYDDVPDRLLHELRAGIEAAERRGVSVALSVRGITIDIPQRDRKELVDIAVTALSWVQTTARVTVLRTTQAVRLSVTGDIAPDDHPFCDYAGSTAVTLVAASGKTYWEARWEQA